MATRIVFLQYQINLTDKDQVDTLQHTDDGTGQAVGAIIRAPDGAAVEFAAPILWHYDPATTPDDPFTAPSITSEHLVKVQVGPLWGQKYPTNVATFTRHTGGFLGIGGTTTRYYWRGLFVFVPPPDQPGIPGQPIVAMATRRWIDGFENPYQGEGGSGSGSPICAPVSSRCAGGWGWGVRNGTETRVHTPIEAGAAATDSLWERFYVRLLRVPEESSRIWSMTGTPSTSVGMALYISVSGELQLASLGAGGVDYIGSALTLEVGTWYKVDVIYKFGTATGYVALYVNGVQRFNIAASSFPSGRGMNAANTVSQCTMGGAVASHRGSWDFDDWIGSETPLIGTAPEILPGFDWLHGSRVVRLRANGFGTTNGTWAGLGGSDSTDWRHVNYRPCIPTGSTSHRLTTNTASDRLVVTTNIADVMALQGAVGAAALVVGYYGSRLSALHGSVGYKLDAAAEDLKVMAEDSAYVWNTHRYTPAGETDPLQWGAIELVVVANSAAASAKNCVALTGCVELIGDFHPEDHTPVSDDPADVTWGVPHFTGQLHNSPYPGSEWAVQSPPPIGPVIIHTGTYVGNGTSTQLAFRAPVHLIWIRSHTASPVQAIWMAASVASRPSSSEVNRGDYVMEALIDPNYVPAGIGEDDQKMQTIVRINGNDAQVNAAGTTYNYVAFCDPAMRFAAVGGLRESNYGAAATPLERLWLPEIGLFTQGITGGASTSGFLRGLGATAAQLFTWFGTGVYADSMTYEEGLINTPAGSSIYQSNASIDFIVFRRDDGSGDPGVPNVIQLATYTGDGTASRTISLSPVTGRRPMWALIVGSNGVGIIRDGSHTGTISATTQGAANAATGITGGGVDSISVGSVLNTNGVVFEVLVFPGCSATPGNNGWGINCENIPVDPGTYDPDAPEDPWDPEPPEPGEPEPPAPGPGDDPGPAGPGGPGPGARHPYEDFDYATECIPWTVRTMNKALSRIGISKQLGSDIVTDTSPEAVACRLHYTDDASATLRDFPWAFATRYAKMALVMGDAEDQDTVQSWLATAWYERNEVVRVSSVDYYCILAHVNHTPPNATYWSTTAPEDELNGDWDYCYRAPARMMFARRIINPTAIGRGWDPDPPRFRLSADDRAFTIYTDELNAELEYTIRPVCVSAIDDALFTSALAWRHAHSIAAALSRDEKKIAYCWEMYQALLAQARRWAANEVQQAPTGDADWITGRN